MGAGRTQCGFPGDTWRGNRTVQVASRKGEALALCGAGVREAESQARLYTHPGSPSVPVGSENLTKGRGEMSPPQRGASHQDMIWAGPEL